MPTPPAGAWRAEPATRRGNWTAQLDRCSIKQSGKMIRPWFRQAAVPWKTTATQTRASGENRVSTKPGVLQDGVERARAGPGHDRPVVTLLGEVRVRRIGYRSGVRGVLSLFPRDAVLNLPPLGYSWALQRLAEMFCRSVSYEQGHEFVLAATGVSVGRRQLEQIVAAAAADAERFCQDRDQAAAVPAAGGRGRACRRWRSRRTVRAWRCSPTRAAAGPGPRSSGCGPSRSGPGPGRR